MAECWLKRTTYNGTQGHPLADCCCSCSCLRWGTLHEYIHWVWGEGDCEQTTEPGEPLPSLLSTQQALPPLSSHCLPCEHKQWNWPNPVNRSWLPPRARDLDVDSFLNLSVCRANKAECACSVHPQLLQKLDASYSTHSYPTDSMSTQPDQLQVLNWNDHDGRSSMVQHVMYAFTRQKTIVLYSAIQFMHWVLEHWTLIYTARNPNLLCNKVASSPAQ